MASLALALTLGCGAPRPSVLLITLDTTRADHLSAYEPGHADTPTYARLAAEGLRFERAYSVCPLTTPAHASILTGLAPPTHGVRDNGSFVLGAETVTLAERLGLAGWHTAAFTSAFPTLARWGLGQGFDRYHDASGALPTELDFSDQRRADEVVDDAIDTLSRLDGDPVFAWVHLFDAHWPYVPPEPFASDYAAVPYDGEIAFADGEVARLLAWWDARYADSVVIVTADHGEGLGEGGERTHGFLLHDGTMRVPLIVRVREGGAPAANAGSLLSDPVSQLDIAPTVLALAGLPADPALPGRDLREGGSGRAYSESRTGQYTLGLAPLFALTEPEGRTMEGAYAAWYPAEGAHVAFTPDAGGPVDAGLARLDALRAELQERAAEPASLDAEDLAQLQALGYVAGDPSAPAGTTDPRDVMDLVPLTWRARAAIGRGDLDAASKMIDHLSQRLPDSFGVRLLAAQRDARAGNQEAAMEALLDLYLASPSGTLALQLAAHAAWRGDARAADQWYAEALALMPGDPKAMAGLVRAALALGEPERAQQLAEEVLAAWPDHAEVALVRARLLLADGWLDEAEAEAAWALARMPGSAEALAMHASILWEQGEPEVAIDEAAEALRRAPLDDALRLELTRWLLDVGRAAEAARTIELVALAFPEDERVAALADAALTLVARQRGRLTLADEE